MEKESVARVYTMEYYSVIKKNEIVSFVTTWMDSEGITLSEINETRMNITQSYLHVESLKRNKRINKTKLIRTVRWLPETEVGGGR